MGQSNAAIVSKTDSEEPLQILIVHPDAMRRRAVAQCLEGAETAIVSYESEGIEDTRVVLGTAQPDCVLAARKLADGNAFDLIEEWRNVPFIVLTSNTDDSEVMRRGAQDHLVETDLDSRVLERSIRYAIERKLHGRAMDNLAHQDRLASLGQLAASVAHEINNPLSYIAANLETLQAQVKATRTLLQAFEDDRKSDDTRRLLEENPLPLSQEEAEALLQESLTGCGRIVSIVKQLGAFSRKSDEDEKPRQMCLSDMVSWACMLTQRRIEERGRLVERLEDKSQFVGRPGRLAQVATNLLMNAAQALPRDAEGNTVWVTTHSEGGASYLIVEDTGPGFTWSVRRRALNPFFTTKPRGEGTGLGLSITNDIVQAHGGSLSLENRPSGGARVVIRIPHDTPFDERQSLPPTVVADDADDAPLRMLLIDDDRALRRAYRRWLRPHEVVAEDAADALERLLVERDHAFDLILCDFTMPDVDGLEIHRRLSARAPELLASFRFLTGGAVTEEARDALESSGVERLTKPASKAEIIAAAHAARKRSR